MKYWRIVVEANNIETAYEFPIGYAETKEKALKIIWNMFSRNSTDFSYAVKSVELIDK